MIRQADISDLKTIAEMESICLPHPWDDTALEVLLTDDRYTALIFEKDGTAVGYIGSSCVIDECEIGNLCVLPEYRRGGIGRSLIDGLEDLMKARGVTKIFLEVESGNAPAIVLYEHAGFIKYSSRKDYYGPGRDAELYCKDLL